MSDFGERLAAYIKSKTPHARLAAHREYWGDNPPPKIADMLSNLESWLDRGGGPKVLLVLAELDHLRTVNEWNRDPDTITGERRREQVTEFANRANEEREQNAKERHARWLAEDERLRTERPAIKSKIRRAELIRERLGETTTADWLARSLPKR